MREVASNSVNQKPAPGADAPGVITDSLKAPFPYFGGKARAARLVWEHFGNVANYVEPFFGSGAVLLARPHVPRVETVNDASAFISNFWRAITAEPDEVARWAEWPVSEPDLHARHLWLVSQPEWRERMLTDPEYFDAKIAGWWVWGISQWIGTGWCMDISKTKDGGRWRLLPALSSEGQGINSATSGRSDVARQVPHLSGPGMGVHQRRVTRQIPNLDGAGGKGIAARTVPPLSDWFAALSARLRGVRVACGDWTRILGPSVLRAGGGVTSVFLDPPYAYEGADHRMYDSSDAAVFAAVRAWAIEHGDDPALRIALCGYDDGEATRMPDSWECVAWKATGGYGNRTGNQNRHRERIWFNAACLRGQQGDLFAPRATEEVPANA